MRIHNEIHNLVHVARRAGTIMSWQEPDEQIRFGYAGDDFYIGNRLTFDLQDGRSVNVDVWAINEYDNGVMFGFTDILWDYKMNAINKAVGGWACSDMPQFLDNEVLPLLPDSLQAIISPRKISQKNRQCPLYPHQQTVDTLSHRSFWRARIQ